LDLLQPGGLMRRWHQSDQCKAAQPRHVEGHTVAFSYFLARPRSHASMTALRRQQQQQQRSEQQQQHSGRLQIWCACPSSSNERNTAIDGLLIFVNGLLCHFCGSLFVGNIVGPVCDLYHHWPAVDNELLNVNHGPFTRDLC